MEIWVLFDKGKVTFMPDPAIVERGTPVVWRFQASGINPSRLRWEVYFDNKSPFRGLGKLLITDTASSSGQHAGASGGRTADVPGDFKYGVRVVDTVARKTLSDDDPRLIVISASSS
jgi:hypothetical protein